MDLIQSKIAGKAVVTERPAERPNNIIDLMDALSASLKEQEGEKDAAAKPAPARKRAASAGRADEDPKPSAKRSGTTRKKAAS